MRSCAYAPTFPHERVGGNRAPVACDTDRARFAHVRLEMTPRECDSVTRSLTRESASQRSDGDAPYERRRRRRERSSAAFSRDSPGSSIMNPCASAGSSATPGLIFHGTFHLGITVLLSNRVMCSLRRDDCARLAAPVSGSRPPYLVAVKRLRKRSKASRRFFQGASKAAPAEGIYYDVATVSRTFASRRRRSCARLREPGRKNVLFT